MTTLQTYLTAKAAYRAISPEAAYRPNPSVRPIEVATAIALVMLAVALRWAPSRARGRTAFQQTAISSTEWVSGARRLTFRRLLGAVFTGCAIGLFIGGSGGLFCGLLTMIGVLVFGSRRLSESEKRSRLRLVAAAPPVVDLFAAGLAAGLLPADAAAATAAAFNPMDDIPNHSHIERTGTDHPTVRAGPFGRTKPGGSVPHAGRFDRLHPRRLSSRARRPIEPTIMIAGRFAEAAQALRKGIDPEIAWRPLAVDGATAPVAAAALRASRTGAPAAETVAKAARDLWRAAEHAAQSQVHSAAVRATVPLALCFLPAFVLVGIVPTVIGVLAELRT